METPSRAFTIPAKRRESFRWAPVGWIGGVAAAMFIIVFGVTHVPFNPASTSTAAPANKTSGGLAYGPPALSQGGAGAPATRSGSSADNSKAFAPSGSVTVTDPRNNARRLSLMIYAPAYATDGWIVVDGTMSGDPSSNVGQIHIVLRRGSYGVELPMPQQTFTNADSIGFEGTYSVAAMRLPNPQPGTYTLSATWMATDGSAVTLFAELPVTIK
jgi:hypothetical protein